MRNLRKLFFSKSPKDTDLEVLNGVRVLSMMWVMLGHAYFSPIVFPVANIQFLQNHMKGILFPIVWGGFFAVDVFFFLSAFLATFLMIDKLAQL